MEELAATDYWLVGREATLLSACCNIFQKPTTICHQIIRSEDVGLYACNLLLASSALFCLVFQTFEKYDTVLGEDPETQNYVSSIMDFIQNTYRNRPTQ